MFFENIILQNSDYWSVGTKISDIKILNYEM